MIHALRYATLAALTKRADNLDASYCAAFYLLATEEALFAKACDYISVDGVDFPAIKRNCRYLDDQQKQLLSIAHSLFSWTSRCTVTPYDLSRLGYPTLDYVCSALYIANGMVQVQVRENGTGKPELTLDMNKYEQNKTLYGLMIGPLELPFEEQEP